MKRVIQQGFSLIELMIAILLGAILMLGVMQVMISSSTLGTTSNNLSVNQDTAKTVLDLLGGEARRAGYIGCGTGGSLTWNGYNVDSDWQKSYPIVPVFDSDGFGLRFTYGMDKGSAGTSGQKLTSTDCVGKDLYYRSVKYKNCNGSLCIEATDKPSSDTELTDEVIQGVTIDRIVFTIPRNKEENSETFREISVAERDADYDEEFASRTDTGFQDIQAAKLVTFYITVETADVGGSTDAVVAVRRQYSASYQLRNLGN